MSEHERRKGQHSERADLLDAVLAADDTGMVRSEADLFTADLTEATEIPTGSDSMPDKAP
jgi:hypothetical protein